MIGRDIFDKDNSGIAFFNDYSWIDGNILFNNGKIIKLKDNSNIQTDNTLCPIIISPKSSSFFRSILQYNNCIIN